MASHYHNVAALGTITAAKTANAEEFVDSSFLEELNTSRYIDGLFR